MILRARGTEVQIFQTTDARNVRAGISLADIGINFSIYISGGNEMFHRYSIFAESIVETSGTKLDKEDKVFRLFKHPAFFISFISP